MAVYSLAQFIFAPILGRISDRIGRRPVIMLGLLGSSVGYLIYGFAGSFIGLFLSRARAWRVRRDDLDRAGLHRGYHR